MDMKSVSTKSESKTNENESKRLQSLLEGTSLDAKEQVCTVDENNVPTEKGHARSEMRLKNLWHRATYIIVRHCSDDDAIEDDDHTFLLVQRRSKIKDYCPDTLDPTPGGVVGFGESYQENAQRELEEEMGIICSLEDTSINTHKMKRLFSFPYKDDRVKCWGELYEVEYKDSISNIQIQEEEVQEVLRLSLTQIKKMIHEKPDEWMPDGLYALRLYLQYKHDIHCNRRMLKGYSSGNLNSYQLRPKPKVIFFDCDDCLYFDHWKTANILTQKIEEWCTQKRGLPPGEAYALYKKYGTALKGLLAEKYIENTPEDIERYLEEVHDIPIHKLISPDDKLRQMLERLDPSIPKFIFTASVRHHAQRCLKALGIDHIFPSSHQIIDVMSCNLETKHCRESFEAAMKIANVTTNPEECLFFDDSIKNIQMGRQMGWRSILVGKVGRDCGKQIGSDDAEIELNNIHELETYFPELFV